MPRLAAVGTFPAASLSLRRPLGRLLIFLYLRRADEQHLELAVDVFLLGKQVRDLLEFLFGCFVHNEELSGTSFLAGCSRLFRGKLVRCPFRVRRLTAFRCDGRALFFRHARKPLFLLWHCCVCRLISSGCFLKYILYKKAPQ
jgi:hypothetical protein